ncbi:MAG: hypothetical protein GY903_01160 [Fuerstiella sp.]|nr:hypothetical protein [Fuerstiella sp.]MCP4853087.1 hypothetical protein [Fuerstiella sp.]
MTQTVLGANNAFVPSHASSKRMMVDYSRNIKKFALNQYIQVVPVDEGKGYYLEMDHEEAGRIVNDGKEFAWPDGAPAPSGNPHQREFEFKIFQTHREAYPYALGDKGLKQASFPLLDATAAANGQKAMTRRTKDVCDMFTTTGNHIAAHVIDVSTLSTGTWGQSTTQRQTIKKSIRTLQELMLDATLAAIEEEDLILVINSALAKTLSESQEIVDYIKRSPVALAQIKGELNKGNANAMYDLPKQLYGINLVVEKTRKVTSKRGATRAVSQVLASGTPFMTARPGSLIGQYGAPSFSGGTCFVFEEMKVETFRDKKNRRTEGRVVDDYAVVATAPAAMGMFQNA